MIIMLKMKKKNFYQGDVLAKLEFLFHMIRWLITRL
jgi:hypothetical protein